MVSFSFPPSARFRAGWEFDLVFRTGRRAQGRLVRLLFIEAPAELLLPRIGLAVGKRQGGSVVRNRGRRVLREAFRHLLPWMLPGFRIVAMLRNEALDAGADDIYADLASLLQRSKMLREDWPGWTWKQLVPGVAASPSRSAQSGSTNA